MADEPSGVTPREIVPAGTSVVRESFNAKEVMAEAAAPVGIGFREQLEAAMILAQRRPRSLDKFRLRLLDYCKDPTFAAAALYRKPVGKGRDPKSGEMVEQYAINFSVRFIEAALQVFTNTRVWEWIAEETLQRAKIHVLVVDVEDNNGYGTDRYIEKLVERKQPGKRAVHGWRQNTYGDSVALVDATADEFRNLWGAERSKLRRDNGQRLLPFHILADCRAQIEATLKDQHAKNPDADRYAVLGAFHSLGIEPDELEGYMDKKVQQFLAAELDELRGLYTGLKEGEYTWNDLVRLKREPAEGEKGAPAEPPPSKLKDRILSKHAPQQQTLGEDKK
jgi:hypothetical protein